jgi:hypothetical protein
MVHTRDFKSIVSLGKELTIPQHKEEKFTKCVQCDTPKRAKENE